MVSASRYRRSYLGAAPRRTPRPSMRVEHIQYEVTNLLTGPRDTGDWENDADELDGNPYQGHS